MDREKELFLSVYVDVMKLAGQKQNINPTWKVLMKDVDLGEPTSFLEYIPGFHERNLYGHLLAGLLWERQLEKSH